MASCDVLLAPRLVATPCAGEQSLVVSDKCIVPLRGMKVNAVVNDFVAKVELEQKFTNYSNQVVNLKFMFPLPTNAAVCNFEAQFENKLVRGIIKPKEQAKTDYESAVKEGKGAYLLEKSTTNNTFSVFIGNLGVAESLIVRLAYVQELDVDELKNGIRFSLPAAIEHNETNYYDHPEIVSENKALEQEVQQVREQERLHKGLYFNGLELNIAVNMPNKIVALQFPSDCLPTKPAYFNIVNQSEQCKKLNVKEPALWWFTKPFVMDIILEKPHEPRVWTEKHVNQMTGEVSYAAMFVCYPELQDNETAVQTEIIMVIDRSGSMSGTIETAKETLRNAVKMLPSNCLFNIVGFGSSFTTLFPQSQLADAQHVDIAIKHIDLIGADMGGTNLVEPLAAIYDLPLQPNTTRQIFCISDGETENRNECIDLARKNANHTRVFSFGLGDGVDKQLIKGIAKKGHGKAEFVQQGSEAEMGTVVLKQLKRALQPAYTNASCEWFNISSHLQSPSVLPPLFNKERYLVYSMIPASAVQNVATQQSVELSCLHPNGSKLKFSVPLDYGKVEQGNVIHTLAARAVIEELTDGDLRSLHGDAAAEKMATDLALTYSLVSNYTSFVAVQQEVTVDPLSDNQITHKLIPLPSAADQEEEEETNQQSYGCCGGGGSTLGLFKRLPNLSMVKNFLGSLLPKFAQQAIGFKPTQKTTKTAFGFSPVTLNENIGDISAIFKGPLADVEGHNCWLNALLPFLLTIKPLIKELVDFNSYKEHSFAFDLAGLIKIWLTHDHSQATFRTEFDNAYGRVWLHYQMLGFKYGFDYSVLDAMEATMKQLKEDGVKFSIVIEPNAELVINHTTDYVIAVNPKQHMYAGQYQTKSFISRQVLATTPSNYDVAHFVCVAVADKGYLIYDDSLDMLSDELADFKGALVSSSDNSIDSFWTEVPMCLMERSGANGTSCSFKSSHKITKQKEQLIINVAQELQKVPQEALQYSNSHASIVTLENALTIARRVRFACQYAPASIMMTTNETFAGFGTRASNSINRLRQLFYIELQFILQSQYAALGIMALAKLQVLNAFIVLPQSTVQPTLVNWSESILSLNNQKCLNGTATHELIATLVQPFHKYQHEVKKNKKKKFVPVTEHILKQSLQMTTKDAKSITKLLDSKK